MKTDNQRTALVTGATGFVGSRLTCKLVDENWKVHIIIRQESDLTQLTDVKDKIVFHVHDGSTEHMVSIFKDHRFDVVFHLASLFLADHAPEDVVSLITSNILFGTQLLEGMSECMTTRIINTGTSWQYYNSKEYNPVNLYAATKQSFEDILHYYVSAKKMKALTLILYDTYGPDDPRKKITNLLLKCARDGNTLGMSPGEQLIDLVFIDDVVRAYLVAADKILETDVPQHLTYALTSGQPISLKELVNLLNDELGQEIKVDWGRLPYREREIMVPANNQIALPGWRPSVSLESGLKKIFY